MFYLVISLAHGAVPLFALVPQTARVALKGIQSKAKDSADVLSAAADNGGNPLQNGIHALEFNSKEAADKVKDTVLGFFRLGYLEKNDKPDGLVELVKDLAESKLFDLPKAKSPDPAAAPAK